MVQGSWFEESGREATFFSLPFHRPASQVSYLDLILVKEKFPLQQLSVEEEEVGIVWPIQPFAACLGAELGKLAIGTHVSLKCCLHSYPHDSHAKDLALPGTRRIVPGKYSTHVC